MSRRSWKLYSRKLKRTTKDQCCFRKRNGLYVWPGLPKTEDRTKRLDSLRTAQWSKLYSEVSAANLDPYRCMEYHLSLPLRPSTPSVWVGNRHHVCAQGTGLLSLTAFWGEHGTGLWLLPFPKAVCLLCLLSSLFPKICRNSSVRDCVFISLELESSLKNHWTALTEQLRRQKDCKSPISSVKQAKSICYKRKATAHKLGTTAHHFQNSKRPSLFPVLFALAGSFPLPPFFFSFSPTVLSYFRFQELPHKRHSPKTTIAQTFIASVE